MTQKRVGLILIIAGLSITLFLIGATLIQDAYIWVNSINALAQKYDSFYDMIAKRESGSFLISIAIGSMLFFPRMFFPVCAKIQKVFRRSRISVCPTQKKHQRYHIKSTKHSGIATSGFAHLAMAQFLNTKVRPPASQMGRIAKMR